MFGLGMYLFVGGIFSILFYRFSGILDDYDVGASVAVSVLMIGIWLPLLMYVAFTMEE